MHQAIEVLSDVANRERVTEDQERAVIQGAANFLCRALPFVMGDANFVNKCFWDPKSGAKGIVILDALMKLLFKPGYTIKDREGMNIDQTSVNRDFMWHGGLKFEHESVPNHFDTTHLGRRSSLLKLIFKISFKSEDLRPK